MDEGNYKDAIPVLDKLVKADSGNITYRYNRAVTLFNLKRYQESLSEYKNLSYVLPEQSEYIFQIGNAYERLANIPEAINYYSKAIGIDPDNFLYYFKRGTIFLKQNKLKEAEADFNKSIELNPEHYNSLHNRAIARYKLGRQDEACEDWCLAFQLGSAVSEGHLKTNCTKSPPCVPAK
jgi:tetratricopeptide (TPR) repeat protein